ncbi:MAG TPA: hypothetical protein VE684_17170, partial [Crenalkalicoccus sp.]|nr:hypothetical protein [Crenalkalicoccus sp.]
VVTMDTPPLVYSLLLGAPGHKLVRRAILGPSGIGPVRVFSFGPLAQPTEARRTRWLAQVRDRGKRMGSALRRDAAPRGAIFWSRIRQCSALASRTRSAGDR